MKFLTKTTVLAVLPVLVAAHADQLHARHQPPQARQAAAAPSPPIAPAPPVSSSTPAAPSVTLKATNPTAIPLSAIVSDQASSATIALASTAVPGSVPTYLAGAPPLPNAALLAPSSYPALDLPPPLDSPEVQQWIKDVAATGVVIPNLTPTNPGGCPNNTAILSDPARCWWTCGGCVGKTDITQCPTTLNWGLTYDDGPSPYTPNLLQYLDQEKLKSTFFVVGSRVISYPATLQAEYMSGHQIAVHTWSHPSLTTLSNEAIIAELGWSKKVIKDVLGVTPNMMRPPFGDIDNRVRAISLAMGLTPVMWTRVSPEVTFDTGDFNIHGGTVTAPQVLQNWENILGNVSTLQTGFIVLEHDLFEMTVEIATGYILPDALAHQPPFTIEPVISCLKEDAANAYIETNNNGTNAPAMSAGISGGVISTTSVSPSATGGSSSGSGGSSSSGSGGSSGTKSAGVSVHMSSPGLAALMTTFAGLLVGATWFARL